MHLMNNNNLAKRYLVIQDQIAFLFPFINYLIFQSDL